MPLPTALFEQVCLGLIDYTGIPHFGVVQVQPEVGHWQSHDLVEPSVAIRVGGFITRVRNSGGSGIPDGEEDVICLC